MVATIFTTSMAAIAKAGRNVSDMISGGDVSIGSDFAVDVWIKEAESVINSITRFNWSDEYSNLNADTRYILDDVASSLAAMKCINYDMSGYTSRNEANLMLNVLRDNANRGIELLKEAEVKVFVDEA